MTTGIGRAQREAAGRVLAHLAAVWLVGCIVTGLQWYAAVIALFIGRATLRVAVVVAVVILAVAVFAGLGTTVRTMVPVMRRRRGLWAWAAGVHVLGTCGVFGAAVVNYAIDRMVGDLWLYVVGGACYALAAALFLPGIRIRIGALAAASALAATGSYAAWAASRPPTVEEWITANRVDRALLRVGGPPPGYTLRVLGASEDGFGAEYERAPSARLHLGVARTGHDTRRADAHGCPVPVGQPIRCEDDGGGRQSVRYEGDHEHQELRLRRDGLVYTVAMEGIHTDLSAARHILSTLRPATDAELDSLLERPVRR